MLSRISKEAACKLLSVAILALVFASNVFRAWYYPIFHDEGLTFNWFMIVPWARLLDPTSYETSNHFLHTYLARIFVYFFGNSELSIRLTSLLAGAFYFWMVYRLAWEFISQCWLSLLTVALMSLNPLVRDFTFVARGYGLGLGLCMWGFYELLNILVTRPNIAEPLSRWRLIRAGLAIGLSTCSVLTYAFSNAAMVAVFAFFILAGAWSSGGMRLALAKVREMALTMLLPAGAVFVVLAWTPLTGAGKASFKAGMRAFMPAVRNLVGVSVRHDDYRGLIFVEDMKFGPQLQEIGTWVALAGLVMLPLGVAAMLLWERRNEYMQTADSRARVAFTFSASIMLVATLFHVTAHQLLNVHYPHDRTGLHMIAFFTLALCYAAGTIFDLAPRAKLLHWPLPLLLIALCANYTVQFNVGLPTLWQFDSATRELARSVDRLQAVTHKGANGVAVDYMLEPATRYYYLLDHMKWQRPLEVFDAEHVDTLPHIYDFYLCRDSYTARKFGLQIIYQDSIAGSVIAVPTVAPLDR